MTDLFGFLGAFFTTICFIPQTIKTLKTRDTSGISPIMYSTFCVGVSCWLIFGLLQGSAPIIIANVITLPLACTILYVTLKQSKVEKS